MVDEQAVAAVAGRLAAAGLETRSSTAEVCCHAEQTKVYVTTPDVPLDMWEFYTRSPTTTRSRPISRACAALMSRPAKGRRPAGAALE